jgi:hypothetical protein
MDAHASSWSSQPCRITAYLNSTSILQRWACFFGHYWWQRFPLPTFLGEYLYDSANLGDTTSLTVSGHFLAGAD